MTLLRVVFCVLMVLFAVATRLLYVYVLDFSDPSSSSDDGIRRDPRNTETVVSFSRVYRNVNVNNSQRHFDSNEVFAWSNESDYIIGEEIGHGKYSSVHLGVEKSTGNQYAIKALKTVAPARVAREIRVMRAVSGCPNVAPIHDILRNNNEKVSIVQGLAKGASFKALKRTRKPIDANETRLIARRVLEALDCAHSRGVMHRDVKASNVMYDDETGAVSLIDWGLAEFYFPGQHYNVSVATTSYKPPELLVGMHYYDYSLDMWSFGCVFAEMLFRRREPLFNADTKCGVLKRITKTLGSEDVLDYIRKYKLPVPCRRKLYGFERTSICSRAQGGSSSDGDVCQNVDLDALDLLEKLLVVDHEKRISAAEALRHPYFSKG